VVRHSDGSKRGFADGHAKWPKVDIARGDVVPDDYPIIGHPSLWPHRPHRMQ